MAGITSKRYAILAVGVVTMLMYGIIYAWSVFIPPLEAEFGWPRSATSLTFSIAMIFFAIGMSSVGPLMRKLRPRVIFLLGGVFVVCGLFFCRFISEIWQLYLLYGVICGYGVGLTYTSWTKSVLAWFGDRAGLASGFLVMGFGMGGVVLGGLATALIYSPIGWRSSFAIIGILVFVWSIIAMPFMRKPPAEIAALQPKKDATGLNLRAGQMTKSSAFWLFCMWRSFFMGSCAAIIAQASVIMTGIGASVAFASVAVAALSLGNGLGRPIGGLIFDAVGQNKTLVILPTLGLVVAVLMIPFYLTSSYVIFTVLMLAEGLVYGMYSAINTSYMRTTFGQKYLATNTGVSALVLAPFNLVFPLIAAFVFEGTGDYGAYFIFLPLCVLVSLVCGIASKPSIARLMRKYETDEEAHAQN